MAIDISTEQTYLLAAATRFVVPGRGAKKAHLSTLLRWILTGCRGPNGEIVHLEALRMGGKWVTSREAIQRFCERLTPQIGTQPAPTPRTPGQRRRASERAAAELEKLGV